MSTMIMAALAAAFILTGCAIGGDKPSANTVQRYTLKDGSTLLIDPDGTMRMFETSGQRIYMKDGVTMELKDGTVVVMRENAVWKALRTKGTLSPRS